MQKAIRSRVLSLLSTRWGAVIALVAAAWCVLSIVGLLLAVVGTGQLCSTMVIPIDVIHCSAAHTSSGGCPCLCFSVAVLPSLVLLIRRLLSGLL